MKRRVSDNEKGKIIVMLCDGSKIEWTKGRRNGNQKEDWMGKEKGRREIIRWFIDEVSLYFQKQYIFSG